MKKLIILFVLLLSSCASLPEGYISVNPWNYYYELKEYSMQYDAAAYYRQRRRITRNDYRIAPSYVQNMYERVEGDECSEIHCSQYP